ncbi:MAG TPA: alpha/beta hydrolase [Nitrospirota bacterium]|nr:alpha/beta hydrolase [Nitrospirota bacterium]
MPFISLPDVTIHYERAGGGQTAVVLVHGNIASWRWWLPVLENPPAGCSVYAQDMRGFGESEQPEAGYTIEQFAADLDAFVNAMALDHIFLVGHSLGAAVALQFAAQYPRKVQKLLLVSPPPADGMPCSPQEDHMLFGLTLPHFAENTHMQNFFRNAQMDRAILSHVLTGITPGMDHGSEFFAALVGDASRISHKTLKGIIQSLGSWTVLGRLPALDMPVLILWGDKDTVVGRAPLERMAGDLPQAELVVWEGIGHAPQLEQPERFHALLAEFVSEKAAAEKVQSSVQRLWQWSRKLWKRIW